MTENAGHAALTIFPSFKGFRAKLEAGAGADLAAVGKSGGRQFGDAAGKEASGRFKKYIGDAGRDAKGLLSSPLGGAAIGLAVGKIFTTVVDQASEAQQAVGGVTAVFKQYADGVISDSREADQALGLSAQAYQELITISGALLKNKGLTDFADQAENLIGIGADLAAQYGGSTRQAVEALNAAMRGESDPIERYAISLNETAVNAVLAANGQAKLTGAALDQAKTQARLVLIQQQSADAQGAFAREADTFAGAGQRVTAQLQNMGAELGTNALPLLSQAAGVINGAVLPALKEGGSAIAEFSGAIGELPTPVKAAVGALVALKVASALGAGSGISSGMNALGSGLESTRIRAMLATDAVRKHKLETALMAAESGRAAPALARVSAGLAGIQAASAGAGAGLKRGLSGALGLVGGPWGAAFIGGTAILGAFWQQHEQAKARVEQLTQSLDKQTGAITDNTREIVANDLQRSGILDSAEKLGLNLRDVTEAALGNAGALARLRTEQGVVTKFTDAGAFANLQAVSADGERQASVGGIINRLEDQAGLLAGVRRDTEQVAEATGKSAEANEGAATSYQSIADKAAGARTEIKKLLDAENERRQAALQDRRDRIALLDVFAAARKEAKEGKQTLNENTVAGRENMSMLLDVADQWNNSSKKVRNAKGAYEETRQKFIELADQMNGPNGTRAAARALADEFLNLPKRKKIKVETPGMKEALEEAKRLKDLAASLGTISFNVTKRHRLSGGNDAFASGGKVGGHGTGDTRLIWADPREWVIKPQATAYYGDAFMSALNNLQVPKRGFANGGPVAPRPTVQGGNNFNGPITVVADDPDQFLRALQRRVGRRAIGGIPIGGAR